MPDKKTIDQQAAAKRFAQVWKDRGYEKGDSQTFWLSLPHDISLPNFCTVRVFYVRRCVVLYSTPTRERIE